MKTIYFGNSSTEALSDSRSANSMPTPTLDSMLKSVSVAHAEIHWVIKFVISTSSFRSCLELNELFKAVFSDSVIASSFSDVSRVFWGRPVHTSNPRRCHHVWR